MIICICISNRMSSLACYTQFELMNISFNLCIHVCLSDASDGTSHYNCFLATRFTRGHCILPSCSLHATVAHICRWVMTAGLTGVISIRVLAEWSVVVLSANARNSSEGSSMQAVGTALIGACRWNVRGQLGIPAAQPWHNEKYNENNLWLTGLLNILCCPAIQIHTIRHTLLSSMQLEWKDTAQCEL